MNPPAARPFRWTAVVAALLLMGCCWYPPIQQLADEQVDAGLKRALITFASARTLNGLISVVQGTELAVQPLGVGVTLTLGQILQPINELIEQFSSVMLFASVAFGVQKILLAIGGNWVVSTAVTLVAAAWAALCVTGRPRPWLTRLVLLLFMIRLAIPIATIGSDFAFRHLMVSDYDASQQSLLDTSKKIDVLMPEAPAGASGTPADRSLIGRLKEGVERFRQSVPTLDLEGIRTSAQQLPERMIRLIVVFLMQTVALPLLLLWVLYLLAFGAGSAFHDRATPARWRGERP